MVTGFADRGYVKIALSALWILKNRINGITKDKYEIEGTKV